MKAMTLIAALALTSGAAFANPTLDKNGLLTSRDGRTLYTFDKDAPNQSRCSAACLAAWPAFTVANPALAGGDFAILVRDDGVQQWTFRGKPLYFFAGDAKAGDVNGDKQGGVWHALRAERKASTLPDPYAFGSQGGYTY